MSRKLMIAIALLAVVLVATALQYNAEEASDRLAASTDLPELALDKDKVAELRITSPEHGDIVLKREGAGFVLSEPLKALASQSAVNAALDKLAELRVVGIAAENEQNFDRLEVTDAKAVNVVARSGDATLLDAYLGAYRGGNTMLRVAGEGRVLSVEGSLRFAFDKPVKDFRDRTITDVDPDAVQAARFTGEEGELALVRSADGFELAGEQKPSADFDPSKAKAAVTSAARLSAADFAAQDVTAEAAELDESAPTVTLELSSDAGVSEVVLRVGAEHDGKYYLQREGDETIYLVSEFAGKTLTPNQRAFTKDEPEAPEGVRAAP